MTAKALGTATEKACFRTSGVLSRAGFRHAFFTRSGGVSAGPYRSLNFSVAVGDTAENVERNLELAAAALEIDPQRLYFLSQVHGREVHILKGTEDRRQLLFTEGDAVVSREAGVACAVRIADCVPLLLADRASGAVAAAHAGWRGVVCGVVEAAVERLRAVVGGRGDIVAAIGPHISVAAFEVSDDVAAELIGASPDKDVVDRSYGTKPHIDLARIVRSKLVALGVPGEHVDHVPGCTVSDVSDFFSFRRDGKHSGRHLAAIVTRP